MEKRVIRGKSKEKRAASLLETKSFYYLNEHLIFYSMQSFNNMKMEKTQFVIIEQLAYIMELFYIKADGKKIKLILKCEACLPKEVCGPRDMLELIIATILDYFIAQSVEGTEFTLLADLRSATQEGYLVSFDFMFQQPSEVTLETLQKLLKPEPEVNYALPNSPLPIRQCESIVKHLGGSLEITETERNKYKLHTELPFENRDNSKELFLIPQLGIFQTVKQSELVTTWTKKVPPSPFLGPNKQTNLNIANDEALKSKIRFKQSKLKCSSQLDVLARIEGKLGKDSALEKAKEEVKLNKPRNRKSKFIMDREEEKSTPQAPAMDTSRFNVVGPQSGEKDEQKRTFSFSDEKNMGIIKEDSKEILELYEGE